MALDEFFVGQERAEKECAFCVALMLGALIRAFIIIFMMNIVDYFPSKLKLNTRTDGLPFPYHFPHKLAFDRFNSFLKS